MKALEILIAVIIGLGLLVSVAGGIMFLIASFKESVWWGLAVLFLPFAAMVFLFMHWGAAKKGFLTQVLGFSICLVACVAGVALGARDVIDKMKDYTVPVGQKIGQGAFDDEDAGDSTAAETENGGPSDPAVKSTAKQPASGEGKYVGMTLEQVKAALGEPKGIIQTDSKTLYLYLDIELISEDGTNVTSESRR